MVAVNVNGSGYASDIFRDIAASFDILQKGNITVLSKKCLMKPLEPDYMRYLLIGTTTTPVQLYICTKNEKHSSVSLVTSSGQDWNNRWNELQSNHKLTNVPTISASIRSVFKIITQNLECGFCYCTTASHSVIAKNNRNM